MKAILIDVGIPAIREVELTSNDDIYAMLECRLFETREIASNLLLTDEEAYLKPRPPERFFRIAGRPVKQPGNGLIVGFDGPGFCDYRPIENLKVEFFTPENEA